MEPQPLEQVVRNIDERLGHVERILPALATKDELQTALANAIAPLATKAELAAAIAPLATTVEVREESERTRRHFDVVAERLEGHIALVAEGQVALGERMDRGFADVHGQIVQLDGRVTRLEAGRRRRS
jgi:hypothetical protein